MRKRIVVGKETAEFIKKVLSTNPTDASECFGENDTFSYTADFGNYVEVDVKLCGVQYDEDEEYNLPWTEAVLFCHGSEVECSEPSDEFFGIWDFEFNGDKYIVEVVADTEDGKTKKESYPTKMLKYLGRIEDIGYADCLDAYYYAMRVIQSGIRTEWRSHDYAFKQMFEYILNEELEDKPADAERISDEAYVVMYLATAIVIMQEHIVCGMKDINLKELLDKLKDIPALAQEIKEAMFVYNGEDKRICSEGYEYMGECRYNKPSFDRNAAEKIIRVCEYFCYG